MESRIAKVFLLLCAASLMGADVTAFSVAKPRTAQATDAAKRSSISSGALLLAPSPFRIPLGSAATCRLFSTNSDNAGDQDSDRSVVSYVQTDPLIRQTSKTLKRASWFSWWSQVILTTISAVILVFAKSVLAGRPNDPGPPFFLSGFALLLSGVSIVWTWGNGTRLSRRLLVKPTTATTAAHMLRRAVRVGVTVNLIGMLCNLLAAEEIIGSLAIKVMTTNRNVFAGGAGLLAPEGLQPLDVLVVQANTNSLFSQFCSLVSLLYLTKNVQQLDPPSTEDNPRKR